VPLFASFFIFFCLLARSDTVHIANLKSTSGFKVCGQLLGRRSLKCKRLRCDTQAAQTMLFSTSTLEKAVSDMATANRLGMAAVLLVAEVMVCTIAGT
jgi:hypothetical protein